MLSTILILIAAIALVFIASLLFINALEWLGNRLKLGHSFVGAILSPLFTSFPELIVICIAIFSNIGEVGQEIGIGTIFGEPFMASSLSYGLVGIAVIIGLLTKKRGNATIVINKTLSIPYIFIIILFPLTLIPGFLHIAWLKYFFGILFLGAFIAYILIMYRNRTTEIIEEAEELILARIARKSTSYGMVLLAVQLVLAVAMLYFGSRFLVDSVAKIAEGIKVSPLGLALIIIPAATAIPETINAIIWGYHGKDTLSIGSLVGEKILYSTFYPALGLFLTSWVLDVHAIFSVAVTTLVSLILLIYIRKQRLPWYGLFVGLFFFIAYGILIFAFKF